MIPENALLSHPLIVSGALLLGDIAATLAMAKGILMESPENPTPRQKCAGRLILWAVIAETLFSVGLFAFDANVSLVQGRIIDAQQSKIIALEQRIAPRIVTKADRVAIRSIRGKVPVVAVLASDGLEPAFFASQLEAAFVDAGIKVEPVFSSPDNHWIGLQVCWPKDSSAEGNLIFKAFSGAEPNSIGRCDFKASPQNVPDNAPLLIVGDRKMFFPNGVPGSLKFRVYPGAARRRLP